MSRKRLGGVDPKAARAVRADAEQAAVQRRQSPLSGAPPIAQVAAEAAQSIDAEIARLRRENRALEDLASKGRALEEARREGRLVQRLALDQIDPNALVRDRRDLRGDSEEWERLKDSLLRYGQQTPIEVMPSEGAKPYDLVTGLRRYTALCELHRETGEARFAEVLAFIRPTKAPVDKLVSMVEENEVRLGISFYERGRICALAALEGVFEDTEAAIAALFASSNRNRRYKIRCFALIHEALGVHLSFPEAIGERLGIRLAQELRAGRGEEIAAMLEAWQKTITTPDKETNLLGEFIGRTGRFALSPPTPGPTLSASWQGERGARVGAVAKAGRVSLTVDGLQTVDQAVLERLVAELGGRIEAQMASEPPP